MQFVTIECPKCRRSTGINLEWGIIQEFLKASVLDDAGVIPDMERFTVAAGSIKTMVGRQNLTHFVCGPTRAVCHYAWSMVN